MQIGGFYAELDWPRIKFGGKNLKVCFFPAWYDLWVGLYIKPSAGWFTCYFVPFPCCVFLIEWKPVRW